MSRRRSGTGESGRNAQLRARAAAQAKERARKRHKGLLVVAAVAILVVGLGAFLGPGLVGGSTQVPTVVAAAEREPQPLVEGQPAVLAGGAEATDVPVVLLWSDFACPHCADLDERWGPTLTELAEAGEVRVELAPVTLLGAPAAARVFGCSVEAGFGHAFHDAVFASEAGRDDVSELVALAEQVSPGLPAGFAACAGAEDGAAAAWVASIDAAAAAAGVDATPTVTLDGQPVDLALSAEELSNQVVAAP